MIVRVMGRRIRQMAGSGSWRQPFSSIAVCHSSTRVIICAPERVTEDIRKPSRSTWSRSSQPMGWVQTSHTAVSVRPSLVFVTVNPSGSRSGSPFQNSRRVVVVGTTRSMPQQIYTPVPELLPHTFWQEGLCEQSRASDRRSSLGQCKQKQGRDACNCSCDCGAGCRVVGAERSGLEQGICEASSEYAQRWKEPSTRDSRYGAAIPFIRGLSTGHAASLYPMACYCKHGWICEAHHDKPWPHETCPGPGIICQNPDCAIGRLLRAELDALRERGSGRSES
jgi:hypothetical protein